MCGCRPRYGLGLAILQAAPDGLLPEDMSLLSEPRPGAANAIEEILDRYLQNVYGLAMFLLKNNNEAEDVAREVFLTVMLNSDRSQGNPAFPFWIFRICVDACRMRLRRGRRTETVPIEEFLPVFTEEDTHARPVEDWSREVERRIPDREFGQAIGRFTEALPEKYRLAFVLCDVQGFSCEETAQLLDLTITAVKARLHRARLCLRERLSRHLRHGRAA